MFLFASKRFTLGRDLFSSKKSLYITLDQILKLEVQVDSGPQRYEAHKVYLNHDFKIIGYHFSLELKLYP